MGSRMGGAVGAGASATACPTGYGHNHGVCHLVRCKIGISIVRCDDRGRRRGSTENPQTLLDRHTPHRSGAIRTRRDRRRY